MYSVKLILEVRGQVAATATVDNTEREINKRVDYWWQLYGLKSKNFIIYYELPSGREIVRQAA